MNVRFHGGIGAGGLGSPAGLYLAAAGVGTLGFVDFDVVDISNLHRQILHTTEDLGRSKTQSAAETVRAINSDVEVIQHPVKLNSENALGIFSDYDVIIDGSDNFPTKCLANDACVLLGKPLVLGAVFQFQGQATVFVPGEGPCYRCLLPTPPPPGTVPSCQEAGVFGAVPPSSFSWAWAPRCWGDSWSLTPWTWISCTSRSSGTLTAPCAATIPPSPG
jgi:adenylyltransferase/sulfurtransferase